MSFAPVDIARASASFDALKADAEAIEAATAIVSSYRVPPENRPGRSSRWQLDNAKIWRPDGRAEESITFTEVTSEGLRTDAKALLQLSLERKAFTMKMREDMEKKFGHFDFLFVLHLRGGSRRKRDKSQRVPLIVRAFGGAQRTRNPALRAPVSPVLCSRSGSSRDLVAVHVAVAVRGVLDRLAAVRGPAKYRGNLHGRTRG